MPTPQRILWAVGRLAAESADQLLEIGCGRGFAASLVSANLTSGHLTAIDRSATVIKAARDYNSDHEAAGRLTFVQTTLADLNRAYGPFDKAFAIDVNLFWIDAARELAVVHDVLAPGGRLFLLYEPPSAAQRAKARDLCLMNLDRHDFLVDVVVDVVIEDDIDSLPLLGIVARSAG